MKRAVRSRVPKFAAYFRRALPDNATKPSALRQRHDKGPNGKQPLEQINLNLPNDKPALQHELVCKVIAMSGNTKRTAIVIKEGEHLGHLRLANTLGVV